MSQFYVLINSTGIQEVTATEMPTVAEIQKLVGIPGEEGFFEGVYKRYSDQSIAILCDDEFLMKGCQPTLLTPDGITLQGQLLIVGIDMQIEDFCLLTEKQLEIVKKESKIYPLQPR
ncbi:MULTISPECIES: DUF3846 domain-containing protein [unclassified Microcoleus]|uniref:DUF3846 domain-containing protein n=1 Tax=unclassified Microcoleus TaxID=2642155 RepID=UPI002FD0D506